MIHLDIMDGKFVNNTTMGAETIKKLRRVTSLPFDAHLMIENPVELVDSFIDARCDIITVHAETCTEEEFLAIAEKLLQNGISPGIAVNPPTDLPPWVFSHLEKIDVLIVMSVNPGFSGQQFLPETLEKMALLDGKLRKHGFKGYIEADGGIDSRRLQEVYDAGAKIMVAGNAVYGSSDIHGAIIQLKHKANVALERRLLARSTSLEIRQDWIRARRHILIPLANELGIEEELHATE